METHIHHATDDYVALSRTILLRWMLRPPKIFSGFLNSFSINSEVLIGYFHEIDDPTGLLENNQCGIRASPHRVWLFSYTILSVIFSEYAIAYDFVFSNSLFSRNRP